MDILYACDSNYLWLTAISMRSLLDSQENPHQLRIFLIGDAVTPEQAQPLYEIAEDFGATFVLLQADGVQIPQDWASNRWPRSAFLRLFASCLLPDDVTYCLYLDSDTLIRGALAPLLSSLATTRALFVGVLDCVSAGYKRNIGLSPESAYVNAGVLGMNIAALRDIDIPSRISAFLSRYGQRVHYADQDILNGAFVGDIIDVGRPDLNVTTQVLEFSPSALHVLRLPERYYSHAALSEARRSPLVIHYTSCLGIVRPWFSDSDHSARAAFQDVRSRSPYATRELPHSPRPTVRTLLMRAVMRMPKPLVAVLVGPLHSLIVPLLIRLRAATVFKGIA